MEDQTRKKRRILPWLVIGSSVLTLSVLVFLLFMPLDLTRFTPRIESIIESRVDGEVQLGRIVLKVLPSPDLEVSGAEVLHEGEMLFTVDRAHARLSLLPLLLGNAVFQKLELANPDLVLKRYDDGTLNVSRFLGIERQPEEDREREMSVKTLDLRNGRVVFIDELPDKAARFEVSGINAMAERTGDVYTFGADGTLLPSTPLALSGKMDEKGAVNGQGSVEGLALSAFNPYIRERVPGASVEGRVDLDLSYVINDEDMLRADISYRGLEAALPSLFKDPLVSPSGSGTMRLTRSEEAEESGLAFEEIDIELAGFRVKGRFEVSGPGGERTFSLEAFTSPVPIEKLLEFLPVRAMPASAAERIATVKPLGGTVTLDELKMEGRLDWLGLKPILEGKVSASASASIDDAAFKYKGLEKPFQGISGKVSFKDAVLTVSGFSGQYGKEMIRRLSGTARELSGNAPFDASFEASMDIEETAGLIQSFAREEIKKRLSKAEAEGSMLLNASLSGALRKRIPLEYSGDAVIRDGALSYEGIPAKISSLDANASFDKDTLRVHESKAVVEGSNISLSGVVEGYRRPGPRFSLAASGGLDAETLKAFLKKRGNDIMVAGAVPFSLTAEGSPEDWSARAEVDATGSRVSFGRLVEKAEGFPLRAVAVGGRRGGETIIEEARVNIGGSAVSGSGTFRGAGDYALSVASKELLISDLDEVSPLLKRDFPSSGLVSFSVRTEKASGERPVYEGAVGITEGRFETELFKNPIENVEARAEFEGNSASLVIGNIATGSTRMNGRIDLVDITEKIVGFSIDFPGFHITDVLPRKREEREDGPEGFRERLRREVVKLSGAGSISAAEGTLWGHRFESFSANVELGRKIAIFNPASINMHEGTISGSAIYFIDKDEPLVFTADLNLANIQTRSMIEAFGVKRRVLSGGLGGSILLSGTRGAEPFRQGLNGYAALSMENGRLWRFGFISDIFAIVNILTIDELLRGSGLPHRGIEGHFMLTDGVISTDDLFLDSNVMRMSAVGEINTPALAIDATIALHPFVTLDRLISNIPLAGWVITGDNDSTVSLYFEMEGDLRKPSVTPMPVKSIRRNVFGIIERLLRAPFKLFE
ncbi:MAG: AsmA-like C-terminal domain-containing protein [Deltaproteobacteria bacterium]|nr:AsmA-like C-terminal domain-containing protein [Deltaproteobacteria bacterium]MBZ0219578.1 AsmA-like C-terminal domain-containing protein [Deltaproteobacteria bacterium]